MPDNNILERVIELGRGKGEPPHVILKAEDSLASRLFGSAKAKLPLADPRLEVLRAISAAISRAPDRLDAELVDAARTVGWKLAELQLVLPTFPWNRVPALQEGVKS